MNLYRPAPFEGLIFGSKVLGVLSHRIQLVHRDCIQVFTEEKYIIIADSLHYSSNSTNIML